jgi:glycerol-3-phosphate O-acyltransferase
MRKKHAEMIRSEVASRILNNVVRGIEAGQGPPLDEVINETLYHEFERLRRADADGDVEAAKSFYSKIRRKLPRSNPSSQKRMVRAILDRYVNEVCGNFSPTVHAISSKVVPIALSGLLNGLSPIRVLTGVDKLSSLKDHIQVSGNIEQFRTLNEKGTVVVVPTHSSNLDSVILAYTLDELGFPPFIYGAGLNLFSNHIVGYFMRNLGAYTVDRRKTDPLYKATLKEYATITLETGYNSLYFPGGTRVRDGRVETRLKKGLLGTGIRAYFNNLERGADNPNIYYVPCTLSYPLVLEASTLIEDHLKREGKSRYIIEDDEFSRIRRWLDFMKGLIRMDAQIHINIGEAMDPFGNRVTEEGDSLDPKDRPIMASRYMTVNGALVEDRQRDREYTSRLSDKIIEQFFRFNVALSTHVVAFAFFQSLRQRAMDQNFYRFLRSIDPETNLALTELDSALGRLLPALKTLENEGRICLGPVVSNGDPRAVIQNALKSFGTYHTSPVLRRRGARVHAEDANLLLYYQNRLEGYDLSRVLEETP